MGKEGVVGYFEALLPCYLPGETEEDHGKLQTG
jgi:hypothetical protein